MSDEARMARQGWGSLGAKKNLPDRRHMKTLCNQHLVWATWKFTKLTETNQQIHAKQIQSHERALLGQNHFQLPELFHLFFDSYCKGLTRISGFRRVSSGNSGNSSTLKPSSFDFFGLCSGKAEKLLKIQQLGDNPTTWTHLDPFDSKPTELISRKSSTEHIRRVDLPGPPKIDLSPSGLELQQLGHQIGLLGSLHPCASTCPESQGLGWLAWGNLGNLGDAVIKTWGNLKISSIFPAFPHLAALGNILGTWDQETKKTKTNYRNSTKLTPLALNATMTEISGSAGRQEAPVDQPPSVHPYSRRTWHQDDKTKFLENLLQPAAIFTTQPLFVGFVSLLVSSVKTFWEQWHLLRDSAASVCKNDWA